jgi:hypothetical protein
MLDGIVERAAVRFLAAFVIGISFGSGAASRLHHRSPAKALSWRGAIPEQQKRAGSKHSSAPVRAKYQSFLDNLVAQIARIERGMIRWGRRVAVHLSSRALPVDARLWL